jgi:hypothetical protein
MLEIRRSRRSDGDVHRYEDHFRLTGNRGMGFQPM